MQPMQYRFIDRFRTATRTTALHRIGGPPGVAASPFIRRNLQWRLSCH
jgi:hypothetical protein